MKLRRNLTLNLGARYEFAPIPADQDGMMYNVDAATGRVVVPDERVRRRVNPLLPPNVDVVAGGAMRRADTNNIVPRVGLAWQFRPRWVLRGGYGIYVDALRYDAAPAAGSPLFAYSETFENFVASKPVYGFPNPFGEAGSLGAISVTGLDPRFGESLCAAVELDGGACGGRRGDSDIVCGDEGDEAGLPAGVGCGSARDDAIYSGAAAVPRSSAA